MFAILVVLAAVAFQEFGLTLGKTEVLRHKLGMYTFGFLNMAWGAAFMAVFGYFSTDGFRFDPASLPTLAARAVLEITVAYIGMHALIDAGRSTLGFLQIITIPLVLAVDVVLGYDLGLSQFAGIALIVVALIVLFLNHGIERKGAWWSVATAVGAAATISLYKYDIANFNSVAFEQTAMLLLVTCFYGLMSFRVEHKNPFAALREPSHFAGSLMLGVGAVLISFAYALAAASVVTSAKRSFTVLASIVSGQAVFKEKHLLVKLSSFFLAAGGLILLAK